MPDDNLALRGVKDGMYRYWIVAQSVLNSLLLQDKEEQHGNGKKLEGLLIFYGNEFIMRDHLSQPQGEGIVKILGKRHHSSQSMSNEILHGIVMIDQN